MRHRTARVPDERERDLGDRVFLGALKDVRMPYSLSFSPDLDCFVLSGSTAHRDEYSAKSMRKAVEAVLRVDAERQAAGITDPDEIIRRWARTPGDPLSD